MDIWTRLVGVEFGSTRYVASRAIDGLRDLRPSAVSSAWPALDTTPSSK